MTQLVQSVKLFSVEWSLAREHWRGTDPLLCAVTPEVPVDRIIEAMPTPFGALVRAILHQQISVAAGRSIITRLVAMCDGEADPQRVLALTDADLRVAGLSQGKVRYLRALAEAANEGLLAGIELLPDEEIERLLVSLPGVGVWTAKMFLLFHAGRPDIFAGGDLGLREAIRELDSSPDSLTVMEAEARAEAWRPYRSVACVALWDFLRRTRQAKVAQRAQLAKSASPAG